MNLWLIINTKLNNNYYSYIDYNLRFDNCKNELRLNNLLLNVVYFSQISFIKTTRFFYLWMDYVKLFVVFSLVFVLLVTLFQLCYKHIFFYSQFAYSIMLQAL